MTPLPSQNFELPSTTNLFSKNVEYSTPLSSTPVSNENLEYTTLLPSTSVHYNQYIDGVNASIDSKRNTHVPFHFQDRATNLENVIKELTLKVDRLTDMVSSFESNMIEKIKKIIVDNRLESEKNKDKQQQELMIIIAKMQELFPINSDEDFLNLEEKTKDPEFSCDLVSFLIKYNILNSIN